MALGTGTVTGQYKKSASAPLDVIHISFAGDDSYPTGGTAAFQAYVRALLDRDVTIACVTKGAATGTYTPIYDIANDKLYVEDENGAEVANTTNLSGTTFALVLFCY